MAEWARSIGFSVAIAVFLSFVGAFGSAAAPFWPRTLFFIITGLGCGLIVAVAIWLSLYIPGLSDRPLARRAAVCLMVTPVIGVWVWAAIGYAFLGRPQVQLLPADVGYSLVMSVMMAALSWAVFRRRAPLVSGAAADRPPRFLERLPLRLRGAELYAVEAEDHYLRVRTSRGSDLILMRLSDALHDLEAVDGAQTHRSWWVARAGVADVRRQDGRAVLILRDGAEAPVSRSFAPGLRRSGWL